MKGYKRTVVIGFDCASWSVLKPLAEAGRMPNVAKLMAEGSFGDLRSTIPPYTGAAWASFATGCNPGKTGVFDFTKLDKETYQPYPVSGEDIKRETYYERLSGQGKKAVIINFPMGFPGQKVDGILIGGFLSANLEDAVYPKSLLNKYKKEFENYRLFYSSGLSDPLEIIRDSLAIEGTRFKLAKALFTKEDWDHFFVLFSGSDWVVHAAYGSYVANHDSPAKEGFIKMYEQLDLYLGYFMKNLKDDEILFLISDHGSGVFERRFFVDQWLFEQGYAKEVVPLTSSPVFEKFKGRKTAKLGGTTSRMAKIWLNIKSTPLWMVLNPVKKLILWFLKMGGKRVDFAIRKDRSAAFFMSPSAESIYLNRKDQFGFGMINPEEAGKLRGELISKLSKVKDPETGKKAFETIYRAEDLYKGPYLKEAPDIIMRPAPGVRIYNGLGKLWASAGEGAGGHAEIGVFMAWGNGVKKGYKVRGAKLLDVAPTMLYSVGVDWADDVDGKALKEIFR